jgi:hypothetical protein
MRQFNQGIEIRVEDADFSEGLRAVVDYRGDVTVELKSGQRIEGFIFSISGDKVHYFPKGDGDQKFLNLTDIQFIQLTGEDTAAGKSWDDWVKRRESERAKALKKSQS